MAGTTVHKTALALLLRELVRIRDATEALIRARRLRLGLSPGAANTMTRLRRRELSSLKAAGSALLKTELSINKVRRQLRRMN